MTADPVLALLAGGLGTRLGPACASLPKSLVPIAGRPFIDHQLALVRDNNWRDVVICTGHLGAQIERHVGDGSAWDLRVRYSHDGDAPLGTAGALRQALPLLGPSFLVLYGDSYLDAVRYARVWRSFETSRALAMMTVFRNHDRWDRSNCLVEQGRVLRYDKRGATPDMDCIDYGLGALRAEALAAAPHSDLGEVYRQLAAAGQLAAYSVHQRFFEIGAPAGLAETERHLQERASAERRRASREMREPRPWARMIS